MEDGDLLGFAAPQQAWDERTTSDRASTDSTGSNDVPSFAKPPNLQHQESVNLIDFGGSSESHSGQESVNLLEFSTANVHGPVIVHNNDKKDNLQMDFLVSEPLSTQPNQTVDLFAVPQPDPFAPATAPVPTSYRDVFADMASTAKAMEVEAMAMANRGSQSTELHPVQLKETQSSAPQPSNKAPETKGSSSGDLSGGKQLAVDTNEDGISSKKVNSVEKDASDTTNSGAKVDGNDSMVQPLDAPKSHSSLEEPETEKNVSLDSSTEPKLENNDSTTQTLDTTNGYTSAKDVEGEENGVSDAAVEASTGENVSMVQLLDTQNGHTSTEQQGTDENFVSESATGINADTDTKTDDNISTVQPIDTTNGHIAAEGSETEEKQPLDTKTGPSTTEEQSVEEKISPDASTEAQRVNSTVDSGMSEPTQVGTETGQDPVAFKDQLIDPVEATEQPSPEHMMTHGDSVQETIKDPLDAFENNKDVVTDSDEKKRNVDSLSSPVASQSPSTDGQNHEEATITPIQETFQPPKSSQNSSRNQKSTNKETSSTQDERPMSPTIVALPSTPTKLATRSSGTVVEVPEPIKSLNSNEESNQREGNSKASSSQKNGQRSASQRKLEELNKNLVDRIHNLEKELCDAQSTIRQLQENLEKDENEAAVQDSLLVDLQTNLQTQMSQRAEAEDKARLANLTAKSYKDKLDALEAESKAKTEELEKTLANISKAKAELELEFVAMRKDRDEKAQKEASMALQLNVVTKCVAEKANAAEYYENQADILKEELQTTKALLSVTGQERDQLKVEVAEWKEYAEKRSKQLETALAKEKKLNEERKRKMKEFVEAKTEEVRAAKADTVGLQTEMDQTNKTLKDLNQRYKQLHAQWVESQTRNRELQRDVTKIKKDSEKMSKVGGTLEAKLSRSAMESEDHKNKRLAAKNELMAVLRQLEAERDVNNRLREKIKLSFTPKVLSQQQSMQELLDRLEGTMLKVATKLGRPLPPAPVMGGDEMDKAGDTSMESHDDHSSPLESAAAVNTQRVLARLENETKRVSQCIESMNGSVKRLNSLVEAPSTRGCVDVFSALLTTTPHLS